MRLGVMCSGNGTNFENIVRTCREDEVVLMVHNKKHCGAVKRAEKLGIPHVHIKGANEREIIALFKAWRVDLIVLAGWMKIISPTFVDAFPQKIINIHPSLLPKYKGMNAIEQAFESGDNETGCTVHYVTEELDSGEIIDQSVVLICPEDTIESLTHRVQQAEYRLLPLAIEDVKQRLQVTFDRNRVSC